MPTAICEKDAAEKDKITIASSNHRTTARFRFIPVLPDFVPKTLTRCTQKRHFAAKTGPRPDDVPPM
jgi:hypothetical protein